MKIFYNTKISSSTADSPVFPRTDDSGCCIRASKETVAGAADILLARGRGSNGLEEGDKRGRAIGLGWFHIGSFFFFLGGGGCICV